MEVLRVDEMGLGIAGVDASLSCAGGEDLQGAKEMNRCAIGLNKCFKISLWGEVGLGSIWRS